MSIYRALEESAFEDILASLETLKTSVEASETNVENLYDTFDDRFLGSKTSDPTEDNDGNALLDGALYWNTTSNSLKVYDLGNTTWIDPATLAVNAKDAAEAAYDSFDDRYLGSKSSDPTEDNDGDSLVEGALYWNNTEKNLKVYNGSNWTAETHIDGVKVNETEFVATADQTTFNVTYQVGYIWVFINDGKISLNDFTASDGTTVVLDSGVNVGDSVTIVEFGDINDPDTIPNVINNASEKSSLDDLDKIPLLDSLTSFSLKWFDWTTLKNEINSWFSSLTTTLTNKTIDTASNIITVVEADISDLDHYNSTDFGTDFGSKSTTDLSEGTNLYHTPERVRDVIGLALTEGSNITITVDDVADTITISATDTQLTQEQVEDMVGGMLDGTETLITVSYDDVNGNIDFIVDNNLSNYDNSVSQFISDISGENLEDLSDVTIDTISSGEVLKWNGSAWINQTLSEANIVEEANNDGNFYVRQNNSWYSFGSEIKDRTTVEEIVLTSGQTTINTTYNVGLFDLFYNGLLLKTDDYTATDGTTITISEASENDIAIIIKYEQL